MITGEAFARAGQVADAVLYEGYVLYPYRASSAKNQVRWQFGVLAPRPFARTNGAEQWDQQTEVILEPKQAARLDLRVRCLQVQTRTVEVLQGDRFVPVAELELDGQRWSTWEEAIEQTVDMFDLDPRAEDLHVRPFSLSAARETETLGATARLVRERAAIDGMIRVTVGDVGGPYPLRRLQVRVENVTEWGSWGGPREAAMTRSLVGVHLLLHVEGASFISALEPPEFARAAVAGCTNRNTFPVMIGDPDDSTTMLSSPIILYDRPEVAAESAGDMCDATEIDEILALRVLTLTDEEKREARATDPRAAAIVDRIEDFSPEVFERLHGTIRSLRPQSPLEAEPLPWWEPSVDAAVDPWTDTIRIGDIDVAKGARVVLRPGHRRTDAQDLFLAGRRATVEGVFYDVDGEQHLAVILDDDPAADLHQWHGRYLYFHPDEVEPLP